MYMYVVYNVYIQVNILNCSRQLVVVRVVLAVNDHEAMVTAYCNGSADMSASCHNALPTCDCLLNDVILL